MVIHMEEAQLTSPTIAQGSVRWDNQKADQAYAAAFAAFGLDLQAQDTLTALRRIQDSDIRKNLVRALDHWAFLKSRIPGQSETFLLALANQADDDPWRRRVREAWPTENWKALVRLAEDPGILEQPPVNLYLLAASLKNFPEGRKPAEKLFRQAQRLHPVDFWINLELGTLLMQDYKGPDFPVQHAEALGFLNVALALRPQSSGVHSNLGAALYRQGKLDEAIAEFHQALEIESNNYVGHMNLGSALRAQGKLPEAIAEYRKSIQLNPGFDDPYQNLGVTLFRQGNLVEAIAMYRQALQINPRYAEVHHNLGFALRKQGKLPEAIKEFHEALRINPNLAESHHCLGMALAEQGNPEAAVEEFRKGLQIKPNDANAHFNLGLTLDNQRKWAEAMAEYQQALKIHPDYIEAHINMGIVLWNQRKRTEAIEEFRQALKINPNSVEAHVNLGETLREQGKLTESIEECRQALKIKPNFIEARINLGLGLAAQGKPAEALEECGRALKIDPNHPQAINALAWVLATACDHSLRNPAEAVRLAQKAMELQPGDGTFQITLGVARYRTGDARGAIQALSKARDLGPGAQARTFFFLAMAYWQMGDKTQARTWYDKGVAVMAKNGPENEEWKRFRAEAAQLLGLRELLLLPMEMEVKPR